MVSSLWNSHQYVTIADVYWKHYHVEKKFANIDFVWHPDTLFQPNDISIGTCLHCRKYQSTFISTENRHRQEISALKHSCITYSYFFVLSDMNSLGTTFAAYATTQPATIGPQDVSRTSPSNVPRTSPKDPIWPSRRRLDLTSQRRSNLTSWGRPNLTFKGRAWEVDSGCPQNVLKVSPRGPSEYSNLDVQNFFLTFLSELVRLTESI